MNKPVITLLLFCVAAVQTLLPETVPLLLCFLIFIALQTTRSTAVYTAVLTGFFHDAFSPAPLGISIPFFLLTAIGIQIIQEEVFSDQMITYAILGLGAGIFKVLYFSTVYLMSGIRPFHLVELLLRLVVAAGFGTVIAPLFYLAGRMLHVRRRRRA